MAEVRWFGRDPAVFTAQMVSVVIALMMLLPLDEALAAAVIAVAVAVGGLVVKFAVARDGHLAALVGLGRAGVALFVVLGANWPEAYQALLLVAIEQVAGLFIRDRVVAKVDDNGTRRTATTPADFR